MTNIRIKLADGIRGPLSIDQLRSSVAAGQISLSDLAVHKACFEWTPLKDIPELVAALVYEKQPVPESPVQAPRSEPTWKAVSLWEAFPKQRGKLKWLLVLSWLTFLVGINAPMMTLSKLVLWSNTFSLLSSLGTLIEKGEWLLFLVIAVFSLAFPLLKLTILWRIWYKPQRSAVAMQKQLHWLSVLGKWSMLDVFVVAFFVVVVKLGALANVEVHSGAYFFAISVILTKLTVRELTIIAQTVGSVQPSPTEAGLHGMGRRVVPSGLKRTRDARTTAPKGRTKKRWLIVPVLLFALAGIAMLFWVLGFGVIWAGPNPHPQTFDQAMEPILIGMLSISSFLVAVCCNLVGTAAAVVGLLCRSSWRALYFAALFTHGVPLLIFLLCLFLSSPAR